MGRCKGDTGKASVLSSSELKRLLRISSTTNNGVRDQTIVVFSYWLGLRAKELSSLLVSDVYRDNGVVKSVLHLKSCYTKRSKIRDVYLSSSKVINQLYHYRSYCLLKPDLPLFPTRSGKSFSANGMVQLLRHLHILSGIDGGSSHSGRRTMITRLAESGVDLKSISVLAGHSSIRTTACYIEDNPVRLSKIMGCVDLL